jgi:hypothetical protein
MNTPNNSILLSMKMKSENENKIVWTISDFFNKPKLVEWIFFQTKLTLKI